MPVHFHSPESLVTTRCREFVPTVALSATGTGFVNHETAETATRGWNKPVWNQAVKILTDLESPKQSVIQRGYVQ